jgi:membrane fusion protein (multidrug efflux system)
VDADAVTALLPGRRAAPPSPVEIHAVLSLARRVALQGSVEGAAGVLRHGLAELLDAHRGEIFFHDPETGAPWAADSSLAIPDGEEALIQPVAQEGTVMAVLVAARRAKAAPFSAHDRRLLALLAERIGPFLWQLAVDEALASRQEGDDDDLFRKQAVARHRAGRSEGCVSEISPTWVGRTYKLLLGGMALGVLYGSLAQINQYSAGSAVIRMEGTEVSARAEGTVERVGVVPGQRVAAQDLLLELGAEHERAELAEIQVEYEQQLGAFLLQPSDDSLRSSLAQVIARKEKAETVVELRTVRAPRAGVVSDVRVRHGSHLAPGDHILTIVPEDETPVVVALLPGGDRPRLRPGMTLHLEIPGYEKTREQAVVDSIGEEVIGPQEARRYLGDKIADALELSGSVVLVRARLPGRTFVARDKIYSYHDGMIAKAEVSVRARPALFALIPGLEKLL